MRRQHSAECRAVDPREVDLGHEQEGDHQRTRRQKHVKSGDVHDDRREQRQRERDEAVREEQHAGGHLGGLQQWEEIGRSGESAQERQRCLRQRGLRQEVEEAVQAEHEKGETEQDPGRAREDVTDGVHRRLLGSPSS